MQQKISGLLLHSVREQLHVVHQFSTFII